MVKRYIKAQRGPEGSDGVGVVDEKKRQPKYFVKPSG